MSCGASPRSVGEPPDHDAFNDAVEVSPISAGEDVVEHHVDGSREVVWSIDDATEDWDGGNLHT